MEFHYSHYYYCYYFCSSHNSLFISLVRAGNIFIRGSRLTAHDVILPTDFLCFSIFCCFFCLKFIATTHWHSLLVTLLFLLLFFYQIHTATTANPKIPFHQKCGIIFFRLFFVELLVYINLYRALFIMLTVAMKLVYNGWNKGEIRRTYYGEKIECWQNWMALICYRILFELKNSAHAIA